MCNVVCFVIDIEWILLIFGSFCVVFFKVFVINNFILLVGKLG